MKLFLRSPSCGPRQTLTGLGLILAAAASPVQAGWDCSLDANGEWSCLAAGAYTDESGADVVTVPDSTSIEDAEIEATAMGTKMPDNTGGRITDDAAIGEAVAGDATASATNETDSSSGQPSDDVTAPTHITRISDDWVPLEKLTAEQKEQLSDAQQREAGICCGIYVDPVSTADKTDPANAEVNAYADDTDTDIANQISMLKGNVQISQGYRYLRADSARLQKNPQQVTLEGNVTLREPNLLLVGDKADVQVDENTAQMENVQYLMHKEHIHGSAQSLGRSETGVISMTGASYSYCPADDEQWALKADSLTLDPNDSQGRARDVTLRVKDVPVFYTPYLQFPLGDQRMTGFLVPSFGIGEDGVDIQTPYYFNLAPDYDLTLTPRYIGDRGLMLGSEFRHMTENTRSSLATNLLPNDSEANNNEEDNRWFMKIRHDGVAERWESLVDVSAVSDDQYFQDFSNTGIRAANTAQLRKQAAFDYLPENWRIGIIAKEYQTLDDNLAVPHEVMPSFFADGEYVLDSGPVINLHQAVTHFGHRDDGEFQTANIFYDIDYDPVFDTIGKEKEIITGKRYNLDYSVSMPLLQSSSAFLTPKVGMRHVTQQLDDTTVNTPDSSPSTTVGVASIDSGLIFERDANLFGNAYRQTLEPRVFYYYAGSENQDDIYNFDSNSLSYSYAQLFRDYRLAGEDYIDDANQISTGVSSRLLSPSTGRELLRVGIGQTYYLDKRDVVLEDDPVTAAYERDRSHSALVIDAAARLNKNWDIRTETLWNDDKANRERQSLALRYRDEQGLLFNTGYQYLDRQPTANVLTPFTGALTDRTVEQIYASAVYPLNNQWSLIGHWNHDITNSRELETIAGFEYDSCCWSARLVARHWIVNDNFIDLVDEQEADNGIFLQIQLKSLGNFGDSLDSMLSDSILGYEDRNKALD
ncbi:MAG: LPS-assembly protein LptD [Cellvibrionales bacterium]|nr:LPS-assembly protein LptD [Cellvibrionales bacterium]